MQNNPPGPPPNETLTPSIFFTPMFLVFSGILLFVGLLYGRKDLAVFSLLLCVLYAGLKLWSLLSIRAVHYRFAVDRERVFPGESLTLEIRVENNKLLPVYLKMWGFAESFLQADGSPASIQEEGGLLWYQGATFRRKIIAQKRGVYAIGASSLTTGDLFAIFPLKRKASQHLDVIVYPRIVPLKPFPLLKRVIFGKSGAASPVRDPVYILGTREYQHFSPARHIHWKATARHTRLQEKVFQPTEQDKVILALDVDHFQEDGAFDALERAIEVIASLAAELESRNYITGFIANWERQGCGTYIPPASRNGDRLACLFETLAKIKAGPCGKMQDLLNRGDVLPGDAVCVYFSCRFRDGNVRFGQRQIPTVRIVCTNPSEDASPIRECDSLSGVYFLEDLCVAV